MLPESRMSFVLGREGPSDIFGAAGRLMLVGWQIAKRVLLLAILGVPLTHFFLAIHSGG